MLKDSEAVTDNTDVKHKSTSTKTTYSAVHLNIRHYKVNFSFVTHFLSILSDQSFDFMEEA